MTPKFNALRYTFEEVRDLSIRDINTAFRAVDDSNKWPVYGRFNATERAIRRVRELRRQGLELNGGYEYAVCLENTISNIVNAEI